MKYTLEPLNEGQSMNASVECEGTIKKAKIRAQSIAYGLARVLTGCSITCRVHHDEKSFIVTPQGRVIT